MIVGFISLIFQYFIIRDALHPILTLFIGPGYTNFQIFKQRFIGGWGRLLKFMYSDVTDYGWSST